MYMQKFVEVIMCALSEVGSDVLVNVKRAHGDGHSSIVLPGSHCRVLRTAGLAGCSTPKDGIIVLFSPGLARLQMMQSYGGRLFCNLV